MTASFLPADWALVAITAVMAVTGLFRGFSGTLAFLFAATAAVLAGSFGWTLSADYTEATWMRALGTLVVTLLAFGIVRLIIKKLVNGLLAQPSDAIFGFLTGTACGALAVTGWAWSGMYLEYSYLATSVKTLLFGAS